MPVPIREVPPPRPPAAAQIPVSRDYAGMARAVDMLNAEQQQIAAHLQALAVYLQNQLGILRNTANWLLAQVSVRNLVPDSDVKDPGTYWTVGAPWVVTDAAGIGGGRGFVLAAPGGTADVVSTAVPVTPGLNYVFSGFMDARQLTGGTLLWVVEDAGSSAVIMFVTQPLDQNNTPTIGRVETQAVIPGGTTSVKIVARATGAVVANGQVVLSEPQLELPAPGQSGASATLYRTNIGAN